MGVSAESSECIKSGWGARFCLKLSSAIRLSFSGLRRNAPSRFSYSADRIPIRGEPVLVLLFPSFLTIPLARQCSLDATLFARLQVVGVTLDFLDDVFLLYLPLKPAQSIFERLAFLYANLCQRGPTSKPAKGQA